MSDKDPRYEIDNQEIKKLLHDIDTTLKKAMPKGWGFTLFIFEFQHESCFYLSSAERKDIIKLLREFIQREEAN